MGLSKKIYVSWSVFHQRTGEIHKEGRIPSFSIHVVNFCQSITMDKLMTVQDDGEAGYGQNPITGVISVDTSRFQGAEKKQGRSGKGSAPLTEVEYTTFLSVKLKSTGNTDESKEGLQIKYSE